jgi:hypothetical protein
MHTQRGGVGEHPPREVPGQVLAAAGDAEQQSTGKYQEPCASQDRRLTAHDAREYGTSPCAISS